MGPAQSDVQVCYIQTPYAFLDVRRKPGTQQDAMAFAGVTTTVIVQQQKDDSSIPLVRWHACLDWNDPQPPRTTTTKWNEWWILADQQGTPEATSDQGYFCKELLRGENVYLETDPDKTYEEQWEKQHDGSNRFLAARHGTMSSLFVMAGDSFGFASSTTHQNYKFLAGSVVQGSLWKIEISPTHLELEGTVFGGLPGRKQDWTIITGSNIEWESLNIAFIEQ
eukprot:scaffold4282_cov112-Cylindrotheca_fusiformis.AAC.15